MLFDELRRLGYCQAFAGIALPNAASVGLHESLGFEPLGVYRNVGFKFDRWHDVGMKMGFYIHALVYVLVNAGLYAINLSTGGYRWSVWPLWGWGLGLAIHGLVTFVGLHGDGMRERMLRDEMEKLRKRG